MPGIEMRRPRQSRQWSQGARDLVRANVHAQGRELHALISRLVEETGHDRRACRRFATSMGIRSKRVHRRWTVAEQQRLLKLLDLYPMPEIAKVMRRSASSIWHMLYRLGANAQMGMDRFSRAGLATLLHVCPETVDAWVKKGWLKARQLESGRTIIEAADFCDFCKLHTRDVVGNRLRKERLEFVYHFAFPPSHAELLPVRQSKKERAAFDLRSREKSGDFDDESSDREDIEAVF